MQKYCLSLQKKPNSFAKMSEKDSKSVNVLSVQIVFIAAHSDIGFISPLPWYSCLFLLYKKRKRKKKTKEKAALQTDILTKRGHLSPDNDQS